MSEKDKSLDPTYLQEIDILEEIRELLKELVAKP